jgi:hypothetical protein
MFSYWVIGIPLSMIAMFCFDLELEGVWYGPTTAVAINYCVYTWILRMQDWPTMIEKIHKDMNEQKEKMKHQVDEKAELLIEKIEMQDVENKDKNTI